jgi:hypothetical protein
MTNLSGYEKAARGNRIRKAGICASASLLAVLISGFIAMANSETPLNPMQDPIPASYFDLNILFHPLAKVPWPAAPFRGWRVWHALWADLEPQKGQWHFDLLDKYVGWAQQHDTEMVMILAYSPQWASKNPDAEASWYRGTSGPVRDIEDWKNFVRTVGIRYKGKIHVYEIWNEPDRPQDWKGDVNTMVTMVREASMILKQIDPHIILVSPSAEQAKGVPWLNEFLQKGGGQNVDVIGYHFYVPHATPEAMVPLIQQVKKVMHENGAGEKALWDTEAGWLDSQPLPDDVGAAYVARAFILNWAARVERFYWYAWDDHHGNQIELVRPDNSALTPAGNAFITIQRWMTGAVMKRCTTSDEQTWTCELQKNGAPAYLAWNTAGQKSFSIPTDWRVKEMTQLNGGNSSINGTSIQIGIQPVLIQ